MAKQWYINSGTAARDGNVIVPLVDGEEAWLDILAAIRSAKETIHMTFWMLHLDHELDRPASLEFKDPSERYKNTLHSLLLEKKQKGVTIRILLWVPASIPSTELELLQLIGVSMLPFSNPKVNFGVPAVSIALILDLRILKYAIEGKFEVLIEQHPTHRLGSWHQKTIIVDGRIAYVGGMNARQNDWDAKHSADDYRRMPHTSTGLERTKRQQNKTATEYPPRHDFMVRTEGALVMDIQNNFIGRWNCAIDNKNFFYRRLTKLSAATSLPKSSGSKSGQIVRTMPNHPSTPLGETGCFEMYVRAIRNAEKYIYIEDQYFRSERIALELANACRKNPKLILVVVTPPDYAVEFEEQNLALASPSTFWTHDSFRIIKAAVPEFCLFYLQVNSTDAAGNQILVKVNTHAKLMIVDDEWYTIGSCNINERGFIYEGEMNISVHDPADAFNLRKRLWSEHLEAACPDDIVLATRLWFDHATENHKAAKERRKPLSRVFGFAQAGPALPLTRKTWM